MSPRQLLPRFSLMAALFSLLANAAVPQTDTIDLPEDRLPQLQAILGAAMEQSPEMLMQYAHLQASEGDLTAGKAARLPRLFASGDFVRSRETRDDFAGITYEENQARYDISVTQTLYHWGAVKKGVEISQLYHDLQEGRYRNAYIALVHNIRGQFLLCVIRKQLVVLAEKQMLAAEENFKETETRHLAAAASEAELISAGMRYDAAVIDWEKARSNLQTITKSLSRASGLPPLAFEDIPDEYPEIDVVSHAPILANHVARFLSTEFPENEAMRSALAELEIAKNRVDITEVRLRPKVDVIAGVSQTEFITGTIVSEVRTREQFYAGIRASWSIFDGFATKGALLAARKRHEAWKLTVEANRDAIIDRVEQFARDVRIYALEVGLAEQRATSARNHFNYMQEQFARGEESERNMQIAEESYLDELIKFMRTKQSYWAEVGSLLGYIENDPALERIPYHWR